MAQKLVWWGGCRMRLCQEIKCFWRTIFCLNIIVRLQNFGGATNETLSLAFLLFLWDNTLQKLRIPLHFAKCQPLICTLVINLMLYIPKIDEYLKILTDEEVKDFVPINFREYFESIREEKNIRKVAKLLYIFLTTPDRVERYVQSNTSDNCVHCYNVEILNLFYPELQLINAKPIIKSKFKKMSSEFKKFR